MHGFNFVDILYIVKSWLIFRKVITIRINLLKIPTICCKIILIIMEEYNLMGGAI